MRQTINPYVAGAALRGREGFFGRQDVIQWVERELRNPATHMLVLFGQRRIGKTSLLMQLQAVLPKNYFVPFYFDLQDQAKRPLAQMLADLSDTIAERVGLATPDPDAFDDRGRFFSQVFLPRLYREIGTGRRPVFLLDEFDILDRARGERLPRTAACHTLFRFLRQLIQDHPRLAFVFAVGRRADDLSLDFTATFRTSLVREIWVLDRRSAERIVRQAEQNGTLRFAGSAVQRILDLTGCHPYLTQLLCQRIWERAYQRDAPNPPRIEVEHVEAAVPDALEAGGQALVWLWNGLGSGERIYAAALAEIAGEGEAVGKTEVVETLADRAARLRTREVEQAPRLLVKRRILSQVGDERHCFTLELFRRWVRHNRPLRDVKDELDRIQPVAERLFEIGEDFFKRRKWATAVRYFRDALDANANHFRARLHLGEALLEMGEVEAAVEELERAHELDQDEAKFALARAVAELRAPADVEVLLVDDELERVYLGGREIQLSPLEHHVLRLLAQKAEHVVEREEILRRLREEAGYEDPSLDAAIYRLRKKLGESGQNPTYIETRRGRGYVVHRTTYVPPVSDSH